MAELGNPVDCAVLYDSWEVANLFPRTAGAVLRRQVNDTCKELIGRLVTFQVASSVYTPVTDLLEVAFIAEIYSVSKDSP